MPLCGTFWVPLDTRGTFVGLFVGKEAIQIADQLAFVGECDVGITLDHLQIAVAQEFLQGVKGHLKMYRVGAVESVPPMIINLSLCVNHFPFFGFEIS